MSVYLAYHYPCMDGAYSALVAFMAVKSYLDQNDKDQKRLIEHMEKQIEEYKNQNIGIQKQVGVQQLQQEIQDQSQNQIQEENQKENMQIEESNQQQKLGLELDQQEQNQIDISLDQQNKIDQDQIQVEQKLPLDQDQKIQEEEEQKIESIQQQKEQQIDLYDDQNKGYFYSDQFDCIRFLPYTHSIKASNQNLIKNKKQKKKQQQKQKQNKEEQNPFLLKISQIQKSLQQKNSPFQLKDSVLFLLDFSLPLENLQFLAGIFKKVVVLDHHIHFEPVIEEIQEENSQEQLQNNNNIYFDYDKSLSGCTLALKYFQFIFNYRDKLPQNLVQKMEQISVYIQDYDIKSKNNLDSEAFVAGLYSLQLQLNAKQNPLIFHQFLATSPTYLIEKGNRLLLQRQADIKHYVEKKKQKVSFGGKGKPVAQCYCVYTKDHSVYNDLGTALSLESQKEGMDHLGAVYFESSQDPTYFKVSLRASLLDVGKCNVLASQFGGGGHERASSFFIGKKQFKKWLHNN